MAATIVQYILVRGDLILKVQRKRSREQNSEGNFGNFFLLGLILVS
jgi:hypothetical protein